MTAACRVSIDTVGAEPGEGANHRLDPPDFLARRERYGAGAGGLRRRHR